jgi:hypothetical protein
MSTEDAIALKMTRKKIKPFIKSNNPKIKGKINDIKIKGAIEITIKLVLVIFLVVDTKPPLIDSPQ